MTETSFYPGKQLPREHWADWPLGHRVHGEVCLRKARRYKRSGRLVETLGDA